MGFRKARILGETSGCLVGCWAVRLSPDASHNKQTNASMNLRQAMCLLLCDYTPSLAAGARKTALTIPGGNDLCQVPVSLVGSVAGPANRQIWMQLRVWTGNAPYILERRRCSCPERVDRKALGMAGGSNRWARNRKTAGFGGTAAGSSHSAHSRTDARWWVREGDSSHRHSRSGLGNTVWRQNIVDWRE